jgi:hypothetical protein
MMRTLRFSSGLKFFNLKVFPDFCLFTFFSLSKEE